MSVNEWFNAQCLYYIIRARDEQMHRTVDGDLKVETIS
jgi:hypothetical protein